MKKLFLLLAAVVMVVAFAGCNINAPNSPENGTGGNGNSSKIYLTVSPKELTFRGFYMVSYYIDIKCNTNWSVEIENPSMFYSVNPRYNGSGNCSMTVTVPEINAQQQKSFTTQKGSITISCKDEKWNTLSRKVVCERKKY